MRLGREGERQEDEQGAEEVSPWRPVLKMGVTHVFLLEFVGHRIYGGALFSLSLHYYSGDRVHVPSL